jgi:hypothetical protein
MRLTVRRVVVKICVAETEESYQKRLAYLPQSVSSISRTSPNIIRSPTPTSEDGSPEQCTLGLLQRSLSSVQFCVSDSMRRGVNRTLNLSPLPRPSSSDSKAARHSLRNEFRSHPGTNSYNERTEWVHRGLALVANKTCIVAPCNSVVWRCPVVRGLWDGFACWGYSIGR